ncbi:MAG: 16S rRNA (uracil(1498)-N(3))-methyltransferase [Arenimonas sp.]|uniref:16S rRNA (uracil(1498)-N(3))-methyltransferase n=1 Tax=Arenimonas sp. TaxID=1872635 RepID=UPI0025C72649|nr:16S rRNA (uracil(1498)-N(3))-methyltransferase [Arenimonas sp.]MBW8367719.1 16S rRNA (uracil(1498)-N(3))-methyltransferase [Arenimonas sp.]
MRIIRSHVDQPLSVGQRITLPEDSSAHLLRVLRLAPGDAVTLFNGDGYDYTARLLTAAKRGAEAEVTGRAAVPRESPLRITLVQGVARGEKMDLVLQKATELGVDAFTPVITERTEVKLDAERAGKRMAHWRGVVAAACEQSGRAVLPRLSEPMPLSAYAGGEQADIKLVMDPGGDLGLGAVNPAPGQSIALVVGPEGGLSDRDLATLRAAGFRGLKLGPRILRTETAGLAAVAALQALYGDLRG